MYTNVHTLTVQKPPQRKAHTSANKGRGWDLRISKGQNRYDLTLALADNQLNPMASSSYQTVPARTGATSY